MKFFRILGRSIRDAFKSVGRNFSLSLASISCIIITLIIVAISIVVGYNVDNFSSELKKDLTGKKFGYLTVLAPTEDRQNGSIVWKC